MALDVRSQGGVDSTELPSMSEVERRFLKKKHMGVSKNNGTPKSSTLIGFSIINHPFWDTPILGNNHMFEGEIREIFRKYEHLQIGPCSTCSIAECFYWSLGVFSCGVLVGDQWSSSQGPATKEIRHLGFYLPEI